MQHYSARLARARSHAISEEADGADAGFTLIELMVVLLIMAILLAIAIPTFLGVKGGASDRAAQSNADSALKEAIAVYGNSGGNPSWSAEVSSATGFSSAGPEFTWSNDSSGTDSTVGTGTNLVNANGSTVSYWVGDAAASADAQAVVLATYSKGTGTCWYVTQLEAVPTNPVASDSASFVSLSGAGRQGTYYAEQQNASDCQASVAIDPFSWGSSWSAASSTSTTTTTTAPPQCPTSAVTLNGHTSTGSFTYLPASTPVPGGTWLLVQASTGPSWTYFTYGTFPAGVVSYGNPTCYATST
jgi:type IV pilus assembly protein PilA